MIRVLPRGVKRLLRPVVFAFRSRALSRVEPYVFVETHTEQLVWKYLGVDRAEIRNIVIVGAWEGAELMGLLRRYPQAHFVAFEPTEASFSSLATAFRGNPRVHCYQEAISDYCGEALFHDATLPGAGSLLPFSQDPARQRCDGPLNPPSIPTPLPSKTTLRSWSTTSTTSVMWGGPLTRASHYGRYLSCSGFAAADGRILAR